MHLPDGLHKSGRNAAAVQVVMKDGKSSSHPKTYILYYYNLLYLACDERIVTCWMLKLLHPVSVHCKETKTQASVDSHTVRSPWSES